MGKEEEDRRKERNPDRHTSTQKKSREGPGGNMRTEVMR